MKDLLMIMNPRRISECISSYQGLRIDRLWIRNMTPPQIQDAWAEIMFMAAGYQRIILVCDDAIVRQPALSAVQALLDAGHPVANGFANLDVTDWRVTINKAVLQQESNENDYDFFTLGEALAWPDPVIPTTVSCFAPTGMSRDLWIKYGFNGYRSSDFDLSQKLTVDRVPMVCAREGFIWHVKERWNWTDQEPRKHLRVGLDPPALELEAAA